MTSNVKSVLIANGCGRDLTASYIGPGSPDTGSTVLVSVEIFPFDDATTANRAYNNLTAFYNNGSQWYYGFWCPQTGPGADVCTASATTGYNSYLGQRARYVVEASGIYSNNSSGADDWTKMAASAASQDTGPNYYLGSR